MLIEAALSLSAVLLYKKTKLTSLLYCAAAVWLAYAWKPLLIALAVSLALLLKEARPAKT
ncbi:MAG: hypothetical protein GOV01_01190 [Candidatus Altiarchaeota archaeon]|nr:hypothetical protein [Candidatus Altiarchaeota archaeon]